MNLTPDSFSDGSPAYEDVGYQLRRAKSLIDDGADALDLGGESTRPGHQPVSAEEEWRRLRPVLRALRSAYPDTPISVDTYKVSTAEKALAEGADIINDVWGLSLDERLAAVVKDAGAGLICMFNEDGDPTQPVGMGAMREFFARALALASRVGIDSSQVLMDPGLGFRVQGQSIWRVLTHLADLRGSGAGLLVGHSRKRFLGEATGVTEAGERDLATAVISALAALGGADVLRVHNVGATRQALALARWWGAANGPD